VGPWRGACVRGDVGTTTRSACRLSRGGLTVDTFECPADGCSFSGPEDSVCGHFGGKRDGAHDGGPETCRELLTDDSGGQADGQPDSGGQTDGSAAADARPSDGGENPLLDGPDSAPVDRRSSGGRGGAQTDSAGDEPAADSGDGGPGCCASPALQSVPAGKRFTTADGRTGRTNKGDRLCANCEAVVSADGEVVR